MIDLCSNLLEDAAWPTSRITQLTSQYSSFRPACRKVLSNLSTSNTSVPQLYGVSTIIEANLESNMIDHERQNIYRLKLHTKQQSINRDIEVNATIEDMHDWLAQVRDAISQAQHAAQQ